MKSFVVAFVVLSVFLFMSGKTDNNQKTDHLSNFGKIFQNQDSSDFKIMESNLKFQFDFLHSLFEIQDLDQNQFFSGLGLQILLSMILNGTTGETRQELLSRMYYADIDQNLINEYYEKLIDLFTSKQPGEFLLGNSIWINSSSGLAKEDLNKNYFNLIKKYFNAEIFTEDLLSDKGYGKMNQWIGKSTENKIKSLFSRDEIDHETICLLINALYFKGLWIYPFEKGLTRKDNFYPNNGLTKTIDFMFFDETRTLLYYKSQNFQVLRLPYKGERRSMIILLPENAGETKNILKTINNKEFLNILKNMELRKGYVKFPKIEGEFEYTLKRIMEIMVFSRFFLPSGDFSAMFKKEVHFI